MNFLVRVQRSHILHCLTLEIMTSSVRSFSSELNMSSSVGLENKTHRGFLPAWTIQHYLPLG